MTNHNIHLIQPSSAAAERVFFMPFFHHSNKGHWNYVESSIMLQYNNRIFFVNTHIIILL